MPKTVESSTGTWNSWKEIAQYLDRGLRTVQLWEHEIGLPVPGIGKGKRSPVFAAVSELNFWLSTVELDHASKPPHLEPDRIHGVDDLQIQNLRKSRLKMRDLIQPMAETRVRQRRQAELAKERMAKLRSRITRAS